MSFEDIVLTNNEVGLCFLEPALYLLHFSGIDELPFSNVVILLNHLGLQASNLIFKLVSLSS